jgi:hypothetical protein
MITKTSIETRSAIGTEPLKFAKELQGLQAQASEATAKVRKFHKAKKDAAQQTEPTPEQQAALAECEKAIAAARSSFVSMIDALTRIENERLYCWTKDTMKQYVEFKWDIDGVTWTRYKNARKVLKTLRDAGVVVEETNEGQCRAAHDFLKRHGAEKLVTLWKQLAEDGGKITAAAIDAAAGKSKPSDKQKTPTNLLKAVQFLAKQKLLTAVQNGGAGRLNLVALGW